MQKKVTRLNKIIAFCFLAITAVAVFNACKKSGFNNEVLHDRGFAEKFFETRVLVNDDVTRVIEILKTENERTGFVSKLPANCGLPV